MGFEKKFLFENFDLTLASILKSVMKCFWQLCSKRSVSVKKVFILSNKERKKAQKNSIFRDISRVRGVDYRMGKVLAPFLSVVIHGLLGTCSLFSKLLSLCLWVWKSFFVWKLRFNSCFCPQECNEVFLKTLFEKCKCEKFFCFLKEQVSKNHLPTRKRNRSMLISFRQWYPTIDE